MSSGNLPILLKHGPKLFLKKIADNYRFKCESCGSTTYESTCCKDYRNHSIHSYGMLGWCEMNSEKDFCKRYGNTRGKKLFELRQQYKEEK